MASHKSLCAPNPQARVTVPWKGNNILTFSKFKFKIRVPILFFADFESALKPIDKQANRTTRYIQEHEPISFCLHVVNDYDPSTKPIYYQGPNAVRKFFKVLQQEAEKALSFMGQYSPYDKNEVKNFDPSECHICEKPIEPPEIPVVDHHHQGEGVRFAVMHITHAILTIRNPIIYLYTFIIFEITSENSFRNTSIRFRGESVSSHGMTRIS